jgi:hypothetical protein
MKKISALTMLSFLAMLSTLPVNAAKEADTTLTLNGIIIDQACAESHKGDLLSYIKTHTKECALKPENQARGYAILTPDTEVTPFSAKSNPKIIAFLKSAKNKLQVTVKAKLVNEQLELLSVSNIIQPKTKKNEKIPLAVKK